MCGMDNPTAILDATTGALTGVFGFQDARALSDEALLQTTGAL